MGERYAAGMPANAWNWVAVWRRNYLGWKRVGLASVLGNLADPMIYLFGLGFGIGTMIGPVEGTSYIAFLAAGMVATSVMASATAETVYGSFGRMGDQRTWEGMLCTQLTLGDILLGELAWAATKALMAGTAITIVATTLGYASWPSILCLLPVIALSGLAFASLAMVVTALAPSYEYFIFYQTLVITPMLFLCGAMFPVSQFPGAFQDVASLLPLAHAIDLIRPAMLGRPVGSMGLHIGALCIYTVLPYFLSVALFRRRLMR